MTSYCTFCVDFKPITSMFCVLLNIRCPRSLIKYLTVRMMNSRYGDEVEFHLVVFDPAEKTVKVPLNAYEVLDKLEKESAEHRDPEHAYNDCAWHPEFGSWMIETTPSAPYGARLRDLLQIEQNMRLRRARIYHSLGSNATALSSVVSTSKGLICRPLWLQFNIVWCGASVRMFLTKGFPVAWRWLIHNPSCEAKWRICTIRHDSRRMYQPTPAIPKSRSQHSFAPRIQGGHCYSSFPR